MCRLSRCGARGALTVTRSPTAAREKNKQQEKLQHKNETAYGEPDMNWSELKWLIHRAYKRAQNYFCDLSESDNHRQRTLSTFTLLECWYLVCSCARLQLLLAGVGS